MPILIKYMNSCGFYHQIFQSCKRIPMSIQTFSLRVSRRRRKINIGFLLFHWPQAALSAFCTFRKRKGFSCKNSCVIICSAIPEKGGLPMSVPMKAVPGLVNSRPGIQVGTIYRSPIEVKNGSPTLDPEYVNYLKQIGVEWVMLTGVPEHSIMKKILHI